MTLKIGIYMLGRIFDTTLVNVKSFGVYVIDGKTILKLVYSDTEFTYENVAYVEFVNDVVNRVKGS